MATILFETNLKCAGCVTAVTEPLNNVKGLVKWEADILSTQKTVKAEGNFTITDVQQAFESVGYKASLLKKID